MTDPQQSVSDQIDQMASASLRRASEARRSDVWIEVAILAIWVLFLAWLLSRGPGDPWILWAIAVAANIIGIASLLHELMERA